MTEVVTITAPVYQVVGVPGDTAVLRTPEVMLIQTTLDPGIAVDVSPGPPTVIEVGTIVRAGGGTGTGVQQVYVQQTDPGLVDPGLWFETNPDGSLKTLWVEDGT